MKIMKLGELVNIRTGKLDANASNEDGRYPFFTCSVTPLKIDSYSYDTECVLVAGNGDLNVKYYKGKFDAYQRTYIVESKNKEVLNVKYLFHFLEKYVEKLRSQSIGGVIKYIKLGNLTEALIPVCSIDIQKQIVDVLEKSKLLIEKRQSQLTALDELTQSVFFKMFNIELKNNMIELKNVIESLKYGTSEKATENGYPVLRIPNINNGEIDETDMKYCNLEKKAFESYKLEIGDILFVRSNGNQSYVGRCATITSKQEGYIYASYLIRAKVKSNIILPEFITFYLNTAVGRKGVLNKARTSAGQYNINTKGLGELIIPLPNIDKQSEFIAFLNDIKNKKAKFKNSLKEMVELYNALLQKAFKGELFQEQ